MMQESNDLINILIVEDNPGDACFVEELLRSSPLAIQDIYLAETISQAKQLLQKNPIHIILLDLSLPDSSGINSILEIIKVNKHIPVIILTGLYDSGVANEMLKQSAQDYLNKDELNSMQLAKSIEYSIERKRAEDKISESEEKYRQIFYNNPIPAWVYDVQTLQILEVNKAAIDKYEFERTEFLNLTVSDLWCYDDVPQEKNFWHGMEHAPGQVPQKLWKHKTASGNIIIVEGYYYPITYSGKTAMQMQVNDVTEKLMLEKELEIKRKQIIEAGFSAQENERKIIGEELHDNINQVLATVKLFLDASLKEVVRKELFISKGLDHIQIAIEEIRKLSRRLVPPNVKEFGLKKTIDDMIKNIRMASKMKLNIQLEYQEDGPVSEEHKITIYRIVQEQLNNIIKHAEASLVHIHIHISKNHADLIISDNGKGFDKTRYRKGIGLSNMINRAELFNGKVEIDSSIGAGCKIKVVLRGKMETPQKAA